jgi:hypothetical protein
MLGLPPSSADNDDSDNYENDSDNNSRSNSKNNNHHNNNNGIKQPRTALASNTVAASLTPINAPAPSPSTIACYCYCPGSQAIGRCFDLPANGTAADCTARLNASLAHA